MSATVLGRITSGELTDKQLKTLRTNAVAKGGHEDVVQACDAELTRRSRSGGARQRNSPDHVAAERRNGYSIMVSAMTADGQLRKPELVPLAETICLQALVDDVAILKTQVRFYYRGHHMVSATVRKGGFWIGVLNESKLTDPSVEAWEAIGTVDRGQFFSTNYLNLSFQSLDDITRVLEATQFVTAG